MLRRDFLVGGGCTLGSAARATAPTTSREFADKSFRAAVAAVEHDARGRLGVAILDTHTGRRFAWRGEERFAMCSTAKLPLVAAILTRDLQHGAMQHRIPVPVDLPPNSPFTELRRGDFATIEELCNAAITQSDNGAANLLLPRIGGPAGLTDFFRAQGDVVSRLDRLEPMLNDVPLGDPRDTTSPAAMLKLVHGLALGSRLPWVSRARLVGWMLANRTGDRRFRAGLPPTWRVADKTGASDRGNDNDVAILWPPKRRPIIVTSYIAESTLPFPASSDIHARLARLIVAAI